MEDDSEDGDDEADLQRNGKLSGKYPGDPRRTVQGTPLAVYKGRLDTYEIVMSHFYIIYSKKDDVQVCTSHTSTDGL